MTDTIGPYQVLRRLGAGGMGEVFLAEDPRLGRRVALKRPSDAWLAAPEGRDRIRREARAAAQLSHPNIAAVYDVLDLDDRPHIVMEYVEGQTLADCVARGPMPHAQVVDIGLQLADALVEAHAHGVIHRDLKPANVVLTNAGRVKVLDFGLARIADGATDATLSQAGRLFGTPGYIAPEQLVGHQASERSDIYSAGVILYELLTGQHLRTEPDAMGRALATITETDTPRADAIVPSVPAALADLVARAMAREPGARFRTAVDLRAVLARVQSAIGDLPTTFGDTQAMPIPIRRRSPRRRWAVTATVAAIAVASLGGWLWWSNRNPPGGRASVVAVLPLEFDRQDADLDAVAAGLSEMFVNELAAADGVTAIPRSATVAFQDPSADVATIARTLHADFVATGVLSRADGNILLTLRLTPAGSTRPWEKSYRAPPEGMVEIGNRAVAEVLGELGSSRAGGKPAQSWEAFQQYAQARRFLERHDIPGNLDRAVQLFKAAIAREPEFALAHAGLGDAYWQQYQKTKDPAIVNLARDETTIALSLDPNQPLVRLSLATMFQRTGQTDRAEQELRAVIAKNPVDSAHVALGRILAAKGDRAEEALDQFQRAIELAPGNAFNHLTKGVALLFMNRYAEAVAPLERAADLQPDRADVHQYLGTAYLMMGDPARAITQLRGSLQKAPAADTWSNLGSALYETGQTAEALDAFQQAVALRPADPKMRRNLGDMLQRLNRPRDAAREYREGVGLAETGLGVNPKDADQHGILAVLLAKLGRADEAIAHADLAISLSPSSATPYHRRAAVLALAGRTRDALAALKDAFARGATPAIVTRDEDLISLRNTPEYKSLVAPKNR